jgi:hypothetical protein
LGKRLKNHSFEGFGKAFINLGEVKEKRFQLLEPGERVLGSPGTSLRFIKKWFRASEKRFSFGQQPVKYRAKNSLKAFLPAWVISDGSAGQKKFFLVRLGREGEISPMSKGSGFKD